MASAGTRPAKFPRVPYASVKWLVDRLHVGTPESEVAELIRSRIALARKRGATFSEEEATEAVRYAAKVHADNRNLYRAVMSGRI